MSASMRSWFGLLSNNLLREQLIVSSRTNLIWMRFLLKPGLIKQLSNSLLGNIELKADKFKQEHLEQLRFCLTEIYLVSWLKLNKTIQHWFAVVNSHLN